MLAEERRRRITELVNSHGSASLVELSSILGVSESTVRRDVETLAQAGRVERVHGGATRTRAEGLVLVDQSYSERSILNAAEKDAIGSFAVQLIGPDDFVYIDAGTTTAALVNKITSCSATFFTNSLPIALQLMRKGCRTLLPAGEIKLSTEAIVGEAAVESIHNYNFTIGFFGTNGADVRTGFSTPELGEASIKRAAIARCLQPIVLCDSSKFSKVSLVSFASFGEASVICDTTSTEFRDAMEHIQLTHPTIDLVEVKS